MAQDFTLRVNKQRRQVTADPSSTVSMTPERVRVPVAPSTAQAG